MPHREALRDLQTRLVDQLQEAKSAAPGRSWLAVESAGHSFLFPLTEAGEIFPMVPLMPMPLSRKPAPMQTRIKRRAVPLREAA